MTYRTLVLHLDDDARADDRLDRIARLARSFEAHLSGVSCHTPASTYGAHGLQAVDALTAKHKQAEMLIRARERLFVARCQALKVLSFEVVQANEEADLALLRHGHASDLVVIGQPDPDEIGHAKRAEIVARVVQRNARPTLVLPSCGRFERIGDMPIVAWDDSREAARAASNALPLLRRAHAVQLVTFVRETDRSLSTDSSCLAPVAKWLERHGVNVQPRVCVSAMDVGNALLSYATYTGADLIVMGAWGQSRWAERLLGGATKTLLQRMTIPTFMSN